jgi:hypothetical protein
MYAPESNPGGVRPNGTHPARSIEEAEIATAAGLGAVPAEFRCGYVYIVGTCLPSSRQAVAVLFQCI